MTCEVRAPRARWQKRSERRQQRDQQFKVSGVAALLRRRSAPEARQKRESREGDGLARAFRVVAQAPQVFRRGGGERRNHGTVTAQRP